MQTQVLGLSVDSAPCLKAWADSLGGITFPLLSDFFPHGEIAKEYGILRDEGYDERAIFVIDKMGIIRYVDIHDIDEQPDNEVLFGILEQLEPEAAARYHEKERLAPVEPDPDADLIIYCTPWCPDCKEVRKYLKENSIPYAEVDISRNHSAARRVREWAGGKEVTPVFNVRGKITVDYSPERLQAVLAELSRE